MGRLAVNQPAIVEYGRAFIDSYTPKEFRESLTHAFRDKRADFIVLDSNTRGQKFLAACIAWATDLGLVYNDRNQNDGQSEVSSFRPTEAGEKSILG